VVPVSMVGRAGELDELVRAWRRLAARPSGRPRTALVTAGAGLGKSLLARAALDAFRPRPRSLLTGTARVHSPAPYDWLAAALSGRDTQRLPVPADALAWLAQDPDAPTERYAPGALLRLAVHTVRALVGAGPAVVVVEDLHALDPASLNLVAELAAASELPALLLVTSRPPEVAVSPELVARTLARLSGAPGAIRQHLRALSPPQVAEVLGQVYPEPVPARVVQAVWERTGGNPYWLTELVAAAGSHGPQALVHEPLPDHLRLSAPGVEHDHAGSGPARTGSRRGRIARGRGLTARTADATSDAELTAREIEVLACLAAGMSNKQVARSLGISVRTVTVHVSNLLRKTGSASRTEAAVWAVRQRVAGAVPS
jgi:DNA-binding CsgD family transcriptional regulator